MRTLLALRYTERMYEMKAFCARYLSWLSSESNASRCERIEMARCGLTLIGTSGILRCRTAPLSSQ